MTLPQESLENRLDLRLGQMAVRKGRITPAQLQEALDEQVRGVQRGRKRPRRLGVIFAEKKFMTDGEVRALLEEQEALVLAEDRRRREDVFLGRILVDAALVDAAHVEECIALQNRMLEGGAEGAPLLGRLLVQKGYATDAVIDQGLELQRKVRFACAACRKEFGVNGLRVDAIDHCPECDGPLEAVGEESAEELEPEDPEPEPLPEPEDLRALGRYRDLRRIGQGAIGAVYEALDPQLDRKVALKVLRKDLEARDGAGASEVQRFVREAQLAANLPKHPNIVAVYEAGASDGRHFIAMEFIRGRTLSEWRKKGGAPLRKQIRALRDVALAVHHAHERGVLHRDLKPGNILIDSEGKPFVVDFGLARPVEANANDPAAKIRICGTPAYMSPEQAAGLTKLDARCDVFALGTILYEILSGRLPFPGRTRDEIFAKLLREQTPPAPVAGTRGRAFSTVDEAIEKVCLKALARSREERTPSARAFATELTRWLEATDPKKTEESARTRWRRPAMLAGAGALLLLGLIVTVSVSRRGSAAERDLKRAAALAEGGQTEPALEMYKEILRRDPGNVQAREGRERMRRLLVGEAATAVDEAHLACERAKAEAQEKANALQRATIGDELKLRDEAAAARDRVRIADETLKKARERLKSLTEGVDGAGPKSP